MNTTTLALGHETAATAFTAHADVVNGALGLFAFLIGWALHHEFAHRHRFWDLVAKALMVGGAVITLAGPGSSLVNKVNGWTVPLLQWLANSAGSSGPWPATFGLLTVIEIPLVVLTAADLYDTLKHRGGRGGGAGGGGGTFLPKLWQRVKFYYEKYGLIAVGPLAVTLPGGIGYAIALPFAALAGLVGHFIGLGTGW
jgi:hypothetical protein